MKKIVLAGGCFWGVEEYYRRLKGVLDTRVGYANGLQDNPSYEEVCTGMTLHAEVCEITYDETVLTLVNILDHLFRIIDPTVRNRQGNDIGTQYRTGIYYTDFDDLKVINDFIAARKSDYSREIVVEVEELDTFYDAETYHQKYLVKNPTGYCHVDFSKIKKEELK